MSTNGRIDITGPNTADLFSLYDKIPIGNVQEYRGALTGTFKNTKLSDIYFSGGNIQNVHDAIRQGVYDKSNGRLQVGAQNTDTLKIIMRSMYLQHSVNRMHDIKGQLKALNKLVLDWCIPQVTGEAEAYIKYRNDVSHLATPMQRPAYMSSAGSNSLEMKQWF
jgi:hypothetical protein